LVDPFTALAAVSSAVNLVKKAVKTVEDVQSLGPVLGKYFDAKAQAVQVIKEAKTGSFKGSALGKAVELELALEQARQFEEQVKMLFAQSGKIDVWARIVSRAKQMEIDAAKEEQRLKIERKRIQQEIENWFFILLSFFLTGVIFWILFLFAMELKKIY
jgi:hypothetical protein